MFLYLDPNMNLAGSAVALPEFLISYLTQLAHILL